ncbi:MAG: GNAT family N-acetyltransferase [Dehalococcoidia bacterium]
MQQTELFVPGAYWTPDRAAEAVRRMVAHLASPEMQALMASIADEGPQGSIRQAFAPPPTDANVAPIDPARCVVRRGRAADIPRFAELMLRADLPPLFIEEFVEGFAAIEHEGTVIACGGLEIYGDCGVIRSIVVDEAARGTGLGRRIAEVLMEDARLAGASDVYLFTVDAWPFWKHLGFVDLPIAEWREPPRASWQYSVIERYGEVFEAIHSMWRRV